MILFVWSVIVFEREFFDKNHKVSKGQIISLLFNQIIYHVWICKSWFKVVTANVLRNGTFNSWLISYFFIFLFMEFLTGQTWRAWAPPQTNYKCEDNCSDVLSICGCWSGARAVSLSLSWEKVAGLCISLVDLIGIGAGGIWGQAMVEWASDLQIAQDMLTQPRKTLLWRGGGRNRGFGWQWRHPHAGICPCDLWRQNEDIVRKRSEGKLS